MTGSATISVEIELGWGFHDRTDPASADEISEDGEAEREALDWFLAACDDAGVSVTFDVVGHLLLDTCDGAHDGPHAPDWFDRDPGTDADRDPLYYFPDVVDRIRSADVDHEVCTHTFSHVLCDEASDEVVAWELRRCRELHGEEFVSFVPPRHRPPSRDVLRQHGIEFLRLAVDEEPPSNPAMRYLWSYTRDHPLHRPEEVDGLVETRTSPFMTLTASHLSRGVAEPHPSFRVVPRALRQRIHRRFLIGALDAVAELDSNVHYWTHLYNLAHRNQRAPVRALLDSLDHRGDVGVRRMRELSPVERHM